MRHLTWVLALASFAGAASAQQPDTTVRRAPDPTGPPMAPDCARPTPLTGAAAAPDSVCLTREAAVAAAAARFEGGTAARLDVIRARVDVAQAENDLIANDRDIVNARASLNRLIDRPLGAPLAVSDSLVLPPPLPDLARLESAAFESRPELAGVLRDQEGARAFTALAKEYWLPNFIFGISKNYAAPGPGLLSTGISLPLPVFFWQHSKGEIAESHHRELELAASYRDLRAQVGQDVRSAYAAAETGLRQAIFLRDVLLPAAREAYRIASVSYGLGGASALDVLDARRSLRDAESQYTDALAAASMARADLQRAVGAPLERFQAGGPGGQ